MLRHGLTQGGDHIAPQNDVLLHVGVAQVKIPVFEAGQLVGLPAAVDGKGQLVIAAAAQHLDGLGDYLDFAGGQLWVLAGPLPDRAGNGDGGLLVDALQGFHGVGCLGYHLRGAVKIPDNGKSQLRADFPDVFQPPDDGDGLARVGQPQLPAGMGS